MSRLSKDDLSQMSREYFQSLPPERLLEVTANLHELAVEQWERLEQNSSNSSRPPSSDPPYDKPEIIPSEEEGKGEDLDLPVETGDGQEASELAQSSRQSSPEEDSQPSATKRSAGKQPGAQGHWRSTPLQATTIIPHHPETCAACNAPSLVSDSKPYMGYYVLDLTQPVSGLEIGCQLHHYYGGRCSCGHHTKAAPGRGYISSVEGRKRNLELKEQVLVGPWLTTFIASLSVRYRMSRLKIHEFLMDWANTALSVGTIDRCIREAGIACVPVVETLIDELQTAEILHLDETPWYEKGKLRWLWVAISATTAVFHIGSRKHDELLFLVTSAFVGWLVSDGYGAYRNYQKRQRCLAHLIRKAIALSGAVNAEARALGSWLLKELRGLIHTMASASEETPPTTHPILARIYLACTLHKDAEHAKLKALAREILNDWEAVIAFVQHPQLPPTNNEAERALRHAVIARRISYGTRTTEGSLAYSSLLSVIETCRLRKVNPWSYIAEVITQGRKGLPVSSIPQLQESIC